MSNPLEKLEPNMTKGRPRLPEGEKMVSVSLRLPKDLVEWYGTDRKRSARMREVLEKHVDTV